jgi:hypothetical protein
MKSLFALRERLRKREADSGVVKGASIALDVGEMRGGSQAHVAHRPNLHPVGRCRSVVEDPPAVVFHKIAAHLLTQITSAT